VGKEAIAIVKMLNEKQEATDEELSNKLDVRLNIIRKTLYKLYDNHLAIFRRIRDKNTGWFVYFWKLKPERISDLVLAKKKMVLQKLKERLAYEREHVFYQCENGCPRFIFEEALEISFQCPTCHSPLINISNEDIISVLEAKVKLLEKDVEE
ncbi:MAG: transcription factor E, partial [Candidatus Helarchaeales archaeon]